MRLVFMVEEPSMRELLKILLPKILPGNFENHIILPHNGKNDLAKSIPIKLRAWQNTYDKFIIVHDQDGNDDCRQLKADLLSLCKDSRNDYLVRIVCVELEAWYFGDLQAVSLAYGKDYTSLTAKSKYRNPDKLGNAKEELRKLVPAYQPISGANKIATFMDVDNNTSHSFKVFVNGVRQICAVNLAL